MNEEEVELNRQAIVEMRNSIGWKLYEEDIMNKIEITRNERNAIQGNSAEAIGMEYARLTNFIEALTFMLNRSEEMTRREE